MAEQNCSSPSPSTPVIITSTTEHVKPDENDSNSLSSSCDSKNAADNSSLDDEKASCNNQSPESKAKSLVCDPIITSSSDKRNGVKDGIDNSLSTKSSFLRPSILSSGFSSFASSNTENGKTNSSFSLQSPKLSLSGSKFGSGSFLTNAVSSGNSEAPFSSSEEFEKSNAEKSEGKSSTSTSGIFSSKLNPSSSTQVSAPPKTSVITVPNFVFGQNLHERVTDNVKTNVNHTTTSENKSNGASEMLFTSVLTSKEVKESLNPDSFGNSKESSSLVEDAARCQEARANKRKYEEVLVTTGEEDEENILQINVKLFAFENGAWVERGRGILRLNDKKGEDSVSSRIVIRTLGNLRVVLNTKIWSKMSLNRASEKSARITAMDPNGQVKIFLIQTSLKDMTFLYSLLEERIKSCKEQDSDNEVSPDKKIALEKNEE